MSIVIGIDVGGSTTKIVGFSDKTLIQPQFVRADDPVTSIYGAFGKFTLENNIPIESIDRVIATGVGASHLSAPIYSLPCETVPEFRCIGLGGLYLSGLDEAIVVSLGTGTALVHAVRGREPVYLGGTGVGGGTLVGLSQIILGMNNIEHIEQLAQKGDAKMVDLRIKDLVSSSSTSALPDYMTAANFGNLNELATPEDYAAGLVNMVFESIGMLSIFAARNHGLRDIVLTGNLAAMKMSRPVFETLNQMFGVNFIIPEQAQYSTVVGAALSVLEPPIA